VVPITPSNVGVAWAAIGLDAVQYGSTLRPLFDDYAGQLLVVATGIFVMRAVDRLRAGLAALGGDADESDRLFAGALSQERALGSGPLEARTLHWWGRALVRRGDVARGRDLVREARTLADDFSMGALAHQLAALDAELRAP
jgi:hypothetical protein